MVSWSEGEPGGSLNESGVKLATTTRPYLRIDPFDTSKQAEGKRGTERC